MGAKGKSRLSAVVGITDVHRQAVADLLRPRIPKLQHMHIQALLLLDVRDRGIRLIDRRQRFAQPTARR